MVSANVVHPLGKVFRVIYVMLLTLVRSKNGSRMCARSFWSSFSVTLVRRSLT